MRWKYSNVWLGNYLKEVGGQMGKGKLPLLLLVKWRWNREEKETHQLGIGENYTTPSGAYKINIK
jgi:hypothetical protein